MSISRMTRKRSWDGGKSQTKTEEANLSATAKPQPWQRRNSSGGQNEYYDLWISQQRLSKSQQRGTHPFASVKGSRMLVFVFKNQRAYPDLPYQCAECDIRLESLAAVQAHFEGKHNIAENYKKGFGSSDPNFICPPCRAGDGVFKGFQNLINHVLDHHEPQHGYLQFVYDVDGGYGICQEGIKFNCDSGVTKETHFELMRQALQRLQDDEI
ncbi:Protein of unknown function [Pyronema omphalodes CBS 100304]|uniref:C2H2-type domain-containing protein n=1 Tax=Pyronema omphalodes (strain CBS 100304) TaxID=1076935 RepID=U4LAR0_PYROM|nr:Protein of unknown function [Pyronema omphalodes CBS 100304]